MRLQVGVCRGQEAIVSLQCEGVFTGGEGLLGQAQLCVDSRLMLRELPLQFGECQLSGLPVTLGCLGLRKQRERLRRSSPGTARSP